MTSANLTILVAILSAGVCLAAIAYVFFGQAATSKARTSKRIQAIALPDGAGKSRRKNADADRGRKKQVQETLNEIEEKQKAQRQRLSLRMQIEQAGFKITVQVFWFISAGVGFLVAFLVFFVGQGPIAILLGGLIGLLGVPRWLLSTLRNRRQKKFIEEFANALDVIVRGVKSGLPLNECLKIIANEAQEPVRSEFKQVVDGQKVGLPLDQSLALLFERMNVPEVNFFMIVLVIQQEAGGNLSEALGNLSDVLRTRKQMRAKIQAMSSEAKASAMIIGSLPPGVAGLVYLTSPGYMLELFITSTGHMMLGMSAVWMSIGVLVMRKMINFNF
jgi:tight adherence protein B